MNSFAIARPTHLAIAVWLGVFSAVTLWSAIGPKDGATWWLEAVPALIAVVLIAATWRRFPLTQLVYWLILMHCVVLLIGAHYTYAEVPLFDWLKAPLGWERNNYDKLGHLVQGFVPIMVAREILLRTSPLVRGKWLVFLLLCVVLAVSAFYELVEWWVALVSAEAADSFLGTQGYVWDTQSDMMAALIGGIGALILLSRLHDHQLEGASR
jgi:putative membrane protein